MFDTVIKYLEGLAKGDAGGFSHDERNLAIAALFYHMIAADGVVRPEETHQFRRILQDRFGVTEENLEALMSRAEDQHRDFTGLFPLTAIINQSSTEAQKAEIIEQLLSLAGSDGELHGLELKLIENVAELLKMPVPDISDAA